MKLKECLIFLLAINLNPLGLWLNASTFEKFFEQKSCNIQQDEEHLPKASWMLQQPSRKGKPEHNQVKQVVVLPLAQSEYEQE